MTTYIVTRKSDGVEVYRYNADTPIEITGMEFATHNHLALVVPLDQLPPPQAVAPRKISKFAYRMRFTPAEKIAIELASLDDPTKPMQVRAMAASLRAVQADAASATFIDLTPGPLLESTRASMLPLEAAGLLAVGRVSQILDTPPEDKELFNGN